MNGTGGCDVETRSCRSVIVIVCGEAAMDVNREEAAASPSRSAVARHWSSSGVEVEEVTVTRQLTDGVKAAISWSRS